MNKLFGSQPKNLIVGFWTISNQNPLIDNQNDLLLYFLAISHNGKLQWMVVMDKFSSSDKTLLCGRGASGRMSIVSMEILDKLG